MDIRCDGRFCAVHPDSNDAADDLPLNLTPRSMQMLNGSTALEAQPRAPNGLGSGLVDVAVDD